MKKQKNNLLYIAFLILSFLIFIFCVKNSKAYDGHEDMECENVSSWGEINCRVDTGHGYVDEGENGYCYNRLCYSSPQNEIGKPCGDTTESTCQLKTECTNEEWVGGGNCSGTSSGNDLVCCETAEDDAACVKEKKGYCASENDITSDQPNCKTGYKVATEKFGCPDETAPLTGAVVAEGICCISDSNNNGGGGGGNDSGNGNSEPLKISYDYENPLKVDSITQWLSNLLASIQGIVGWLAIIMIFVGGIMYIVSGGSQSQVTFAKGIIIWALVGFGLAVAAPAVLKEIKELATSGNVGASSTLIDDANSIKKIVTNILKFLFSIIGILALLGFVLGGIMYLTSMGDRSKTDSAKKIILYSIIAIAVSGSGIIILKFIISLLEANLKI